MLNRENLLALRSALDAVLGDMGDEPAPRKRQTEKEKRIALHRKNFAAGTWKSEERWKKDEEKQNKKLKQKIA